MASKPTKKRLNLARKIDGKRHIYREIRCVWLGWHSPSFMSDTWTWCWYCGEDLD